MSGRIQVDYEELHRMARVWSAAAAEFARLAVAVASLAALPSMLRGFLLDPVGAARAEAALVRASVGPAGLASLAAKLSADAVRLDAVVGREQLADDLPIRQAAILFADLVALPWELAVSPFGALRSDRHDAGVLADGVIGALAPFTETLLAVTSPSPVFRADVLGRRPVRVDPVLGLPLTGADRVEHQGPGVVVVSSYRPDWGGVAPASLAEAMARVVDLEQQTSAQIAITAITGADGVRRFVIELPGIRELASRRQPQDLVGAIDAMAGTATTYTRCVRSALDRAGVPRGASVMLIGHSDGGIVAMDLASDPTFNGSRVQVTHVVAAGSPISGKNTAAGSSTRVLSVENVNDVVTHLDGVDSAHRAPTQDRLAYEYSDDEHGAGRNHSGAGYVEHMEGLATSPNPLMRSFQASVQPYLWSLPGAAITTVFTLKDSEGGE